ncbi:MAG: UDP-N-acetylmuramyl-tripeptide synthetase, partial [Actinomycetia bacterium]|nr:UDP-N-acetylmuramyl-tripeptide synthetase [Actinomycetes bacterium]
EVSSHALALHRVDGTRFDVAGFTNLGRDHLDFHSTMEAYFEAKAELFTPEMTRVAVLNADDAAGQRLIRRLREADTVPVVTYGYDPVDDYRLMDWQPDAGGSRFTVRHGGRDLDIRLAMPGEYNARNAVLALAMIDAGGYDGAAAAEGLRRACVPGRMEPVWLGPDAPYAYVDFGHTPQAIAAALGAVPKPRVAVVGAGGDRDPAKRGPMGAAAAEAAQVVIVTDDNPRSEDPAVIRAAVRAGAEPVAARLGHRVVEVAPREAALAFALETAAPGESVVVLGKGHETTQLLADGAHPFSDAAVLREAWQRQQRARA